MSQVAAARALGLSVSYYNQIENDERPLTVAVLSKIASTFGVSEQMFSDGDEARLISEVREALRSISFEEAPTPEELRQLASSMPAMGRALVTMHRRLREAVDRADAMADRFGGGARNIGSPLPLMPFEEARDFFAARRNHVDELDTRAERLFKEAKLTVGDTSPGLARWISERHGVEIVIDQEGRGTSAPPRRFDATTRRLTLASHLTPSQRSFQMGTQLALLSLDDCLKRLVDETNFSSEEARTLARIGLANYFAGSLLMPYTPFLEAAEAVSYDIDLLRQRFGVGFEVACHRLSTLQRVGASSVNGEVSDESLDADSISVSGPLGPIHGSIINDGPGSKLIFVPYGLLPENAAISVTLSGDIRSTMKLGLDAAYGFTFHTGPYAMDRSSELHVYCNFESAYVRKDLALSFTSDLPGAQIEIGWSKNLAATRPLAWTVGEVLDLESVPSSGSVKVFARTVESGIAVGDVYSFIHKLVDAFPPASEEGRCDCVPGNDEAIVAWAASVKKHYGGHVTERWKSDDITDGAPMGNGGVFAYLFDPPIADGVGWDLVVGENAFRNTGNGLIFAELFYVEVSSNGVDYARFDGVSLTQESGAYLSLEPGLVYGLGSTQIAKYTADYRQPYDLSWLRNKKTVLEGTVDLTSITHVRFVDIPGTVVEETYEFEGHPHTYSPAYDNFGNVIQDAYLTSDSGGADVFAPGALHTAQ